MTTLSDGQAIAVILGEHRRDQPARPWLARLSRALEAMVTLSSGIVADLVSRARPRWGVRDADDAAAYLEFWSQLTARHDSPALRGGHADVLFLLGARERAGEALDIYLAASRRDPEVFIEYAGDFGDLASELGRRKDFDLAKVAFYAARVDQGQMEEDELRDAVRELFAEHGDDPQLRAQLLSIAHKSLRQVT